MFTARDEAEIKARLDKLEEQVKRHDGQLNDAANQIAYLQDPSLKPQLPEVTGE